MPVLKDHVTDKGCAMRKGKRTSLDGQHLPLRQLSLHNRTDVQNDLQTLKSRDDF